jgi:small-conductance mechanosensitive channel
MGAYSEKVNNEKELGKAVNNQADSIEITGDLAKKVIRIKATGKIAWIIAIGAIALVAAIFLASPATSGVIAPAGIAALTPAVGVLGLDAAKAAVFIAVGGGGVSVLKSLRKYILVKHSEDHITLVRD